MHYLMRYLLCFMVGTNIYAQTDYSPKVVIAMIELERKALQVHEELLQQSQGNENMRRSILQTIERIKQRIASLEEAKKPNYKSSNYN